MPCCLACNCCLVASVAVAAGRAQPPAAGGRVASCPAPTNCLTPCWLQGATAGAERPAGGHPLHCHTGGGRGGPCASAASSPGAPAAVRLKACSGPSLTPAPGPLARRAARGGLAAAGRERADHWPASGGLQGSAGLPRKTALFARHVGGLPTGPPALRLPRSPSSLLPPRSCSSPPC